MIFSHSRLTASTASTPIALGLYFYYSNSSHFALFSEVHVCLRLLTIGHPVGRDDIVFIIALPNVQDEALVLLNICWILKGIFKTLP